jgi:ribonuclease HI
MKGHGFAHPPPSFLPQSIHMARLAAKADLLSYTILINTDPNWHHTNPYHTEYPDTHVITYIPPNTLQYHDPIKPMYDDDPYIEPQALQILCIHHKTSTIGDLASIQQLSTYTITPDLLLRIALSTPPNTKVQYNKTWHTLPDPPPPIHFANTALLFPNYTFALPLKYLPKYSYYTDGSFYPPKQISPNNWRPEMASYGVFSPIKNLHISERLPGLQNILRAELMAIYTTIKLSITNYIEEPVFIFTDSLNSLYLLNTQIKHPSLHNNHPDKTILTQIIEMLQSRTQPTSLCKVKAHSNIIGNEIVDTLAKNGWHKQHSLPTESHEFAHSTPYYFHKDEWIGMHYKGPIRNFQRYLIKYTTDNHLTELARNFPNIHKWTSDTNIDRISSNNFWTNPQISETQILNNLLSSAPINMWAMPTNTSFGP